ncbi:hypothetical protein [Mangrovibacterium lignilyticum]|uniref:hypothetical protein n=1 Tax=Mangrovibacterium lignilyticum TaxID=2668052 RepID=UPI0013CF92A3|nr:hypothetical protein [Mangrovibacterium lignilyticum]
MAELIRPKWDISVTIQKGKQAVSLTTSYEVALQPRLQPDELPQFQTNLDELEKRRSGQSEQLTNQKSKTLGQDEVMASLHQTVISIRDLVKSAHPTGEVAKAFGVGEKITKSVSSVIAASNMVQTAYAENTAWSNQAGLIEADITEITELQTALVATDDVQEASKFTRKAATMDKNTLQRAVEDEITRLSAVGIRVFEKADPEIAKLFEDLIPN